MPIRLRKILSGIQVRTSRPFYLEVLYVVIAFALMVILSYYYMSNIVHQHLIHNAEAALDSIETRIAVDFKEPETVLDTIAETIRLMVLGDEGFDKIIDYLTNLTDHVFANKQLIESFAHTYGVFDYYDGQFHRFHIGTDWIPPDGFVPEQRPWYIAAIQGNGKIGITEPYWNLVANRNVITFSRLLLDDDDSPLAVICLDVELERVRGLALTTGFTEGDCGVLLDKNLNVLAHPDKEIWGQNLHDLHIGISELANDLEKGVPVSEYGLNNHRGEPSIAFFRQIGNGWYIGLVTPKEAYYSEIKRMLLTLIALGSALALVLSIILIRVIREKQKSDERIRVMFDATPLSAILWDKNTRIIDCNEEAYKLHDLSSKKEYIERFVELSPKYQPDGSLSNEKGVEFFKKALEEGYCRFEWVRQSVNGELIPCEITYIRIKLNRDFFIAEYIRDLREHIEKIAMTREVEDSIATINTLENILNGLDVMVYVTVPETGEILFMNNLMKEQFNVRDDCVGHFCYKIFHEDINERCSFCPCNELDLDPGRAVIWAERSSITNRVYRNTDCYIEWPGGKIVHLQHRVDITELNEAKEEALEASRAKSNFLARVSHEIRTPLNVILGIAEIQLQNERIHPDTQDALGKIYSSGYLLLKIINDILDLSKIEAGKLELVPVEYDVVSLINDTVHLNILRYDSKPIVFNLNVDENIPLILFGDELRIKQILNNLLSNAFKYTETGEVGLTATAENVQEESGFINLVFSISDTGQGMTQEQMDKLFTEYTRFNMEANRTTEGTGLGMNITKHLVQMMDGEIFVESEPEKGTVFTVRLPQKVVGNIVLGKGLTENLQRFRINKVSPKDKAPQIIRDYMPYGRVLVVDDVETNLYVVRGLMTPYGLSVETATSGFEAIEKIQNGADYDIIFMDHFMPKMDGMETAKVIRGMGYTKPIVALTANALAGQAEMFLANGFQGFISKPIDIRQLDAALNTWIRDKYPLEVVEAARRLKENLKIQSINEKKQLSASGSLSEVFVRDAKKAIVTIKAIHSNNYRRSNDVQMYVISVHSMKSALANIGEEELSGFAAMLEQAGRENDIEEMTMETPAFIEALQAVISRIDTSKISGNNVILDEDQEYLSGKLLAIQKACAVYDKKTVKDVLIELKAKTWPQSVVDMLDVIAEHLLHSDFDEAASVVEKYLNL